MLESIEYFGSYCSIVGIYQVKFGDGTLLLNVVGSKKSSCGGAFRQSTQTILPIKYPSKIV